MKKEFIKLQMVAFLEMKFKLQVWPGCRELNLVGKAQLELKFNQVYCYTEFKTFHWVEAFAPKIKILQFWFSNIKLCSSSTRLTLTEHQQLSSSQYLIVYFDVLDITSPSSSEKKLNDVEIIFPSRPLALNEV